jgi:hypothetical protein
MRVFCGSIRQIVNLKINFEVVKSWKCITFIIVIDKISIPNPIYFQKPKKML